MKEQEYFNLKIAHFIKKYRPDHIDERAALEFEAELIGLIRATHMQAVEPFALRLADAMKLQQMFPFPTTPDKKS